MIRKIRTEYETTAGTSEIHRPSLIARSLIVWPLSNLRGVGLSHLTKLRRALEQHFPSVELCRGSCEFHEVSARCQHSADVDTTASGRDPGIHQVSPRFLSESVLVVTKKLISARASVAHPFRRDDRLRGTRFASGSRRGSRRKNVKKRCNFNAPGRCPGPPEPAVTSRGRRTPLPAPPTGSSLEDAPP